MSPFLQIMGTWRLSNRLLKTTFANDTPDMSPMIQWEAHKCVVRGYLLAIAARKKEHQMLIRDLSNKITLLESQHKCSLGLKVMTELAETRALLLEELLKRQGNGRR